MKVKKFESILSNEKVNVFKLKNNMLVYFCKKEGFKEKIGMLGTKYGSLDFDFISSKSKERIEVEDGIAHFLEHKLFEQEDGNALDLFSREGVSSNAYTSFDHTVYFFQTDKNFDKCLDMLFSFVSSPYFTDENVEKEKGIIAQELKMYEDEPDYVVYFNLLRAMYSKIHLYIDIGGTVETINKITKERLYDCYETFYNPENMFCIIIGDIEEKELENNLNKLSEKYMKLKSMPVKKYIEEEPYKVSKQNITKKMDVSTNYLCIGFKQHPKEYEQNALSRAIVDIINESCFGKISEFNENMYKRGYINDPIQINYESGKGFAHTLIMATTNYLEELKSEVIKYLNELKEKVIDEELFNIAKRKLIGAKIFETEDVMQVHREIIDSIIEEYETFSYDNYLKNVTLDQVNNYIKNELDINNMSISCIINK